ncbi:ABC transporter permease [Celeribacter baekdonensis]|uniref:ABC transporter permease n=1 Tax=Celeribacter baekdonensis TaxID=875171 RepID=UPI003A947927
MTAVPTSSSGVAPLAVRLATLIDRESKTRFAGGSLGFLWAYITPITWVAFVVFIIRVTGRTPPITAEPEIFVATGILPYIVFRQSLNSMIRGAIFNRQMLVIRGVSLGDLLLATALLEFANMIVMMIVIFGAISIMFGIAPPSDPFKVAMGMSGAWFLATGFGRLASLLGLMSDMIARLIPILLRPTFWLAGIFYTATELPGTLRDLLWWSPLLHVTEIIREGYFLGYHSPISSPMVILVAGLVPYVASFFLEGIVLRKGASKLRL